MVGNPKRLDEMTDDEIKRILFDCTARSPGQWSVGYNEAHMYGVIGSDGRETIAFPCFLPFRLTEHNAAYISKTTFRLTGYEAALEEILVLRAALKQAAKEPSSAE